MAYRIAVFILETKRLSAETQCVVGVKDVATEFMYGPKNCNLAELQSHIEHMLVEFPEKLKVFRAQEAAKKRVLSGREKDTPNQEESPQQEEAGKDVEEKKPAQEQELPLAAGKEQEEKKELSADNFM